MFEKLALIGCGLMGGSFALAARQAKLVGSVSGYSRSTASAQKALELGIVDAVAATAADCVRGADLVLVAVPVASTQATLSSLLPQLEPHALVMDVGSTKADVVRAAEQALGERIEQFMPAHPMCGKEVAGIEHADAKLYAGQQLILTPLPAHSAAQIERARALWAALGCQVKTLEPQLHDEALAAVSHFPHLLAFAFMKRRCIHHNQQLRAMVLGVLGGLLKPSVLANQQTHLNTFYFKNCAVLTWDKVPAFIKHLVVG